VEWFLRFNSVYDIIRPVFDIAILAYLLYKSYDLLLKTQAAKELYHAYAAKLPVIDYHCHINPADIAEDRRYDNIAQIWITCGDHYKWRAVRGNGTDEEYITGGASDYEKFEAFARAMPKLIGNPLYIWAHMELKRYFGFHEPLDLSNAKKAWNCANERLRDKNMSARGIMASSDVRLICTTDDPSDSLEHHKSIAGDGSFDIKVLPAFRPDKSLHIEKDGYAEYMQKLAQSAGTEIRSLSDLFSALQKRLDFFVNMGCKTADNGFEAIPFQRGDAGIAFKKALEGKFLTQEEISIFKTELFIFLAEEYHKRGLVMQIHFGVSRNNSSRLYGSIGSDAGADAIGNYNCIMNLTHILNALDTKGVLPKTVLYSINPNDNAALGALIGCFQDSSAAGKLQHGAAWWFNDTNLGIRAHLYNLAESALLGNFIGMLTDSRSFLSYVRHDYFRRILCDVIGGFVENGEYPDTPYLYEMIRNICFANASEYFGFGERIYKNF